MLRVAFASVALTAVGSLCLAGCPSSSSTYECPPGQYYDSNAGTCMGGGYQQCPPGSTMGPQGCMAQQQCPAGQVFNGQMCVQQGGAPQCPAGQQWNGQQCAPAAGGLGGMFGTAPQCTPAQPLDPNSTAAVSQGLPVLAQQQAPGSKPVGSALAGNFQAGQCLEMQVTLNPGKCYTAVGIGAQGQEVDVHLVPGLPSPVPLPPLAQDNSTGPMAVLGGGGNCFKNPSPFPGPAKLVLRVASGQGMAAAQLYEK
ncbi:MAG: hypothetical protein HOW73_30755 [Polyangiaceae bacterium]|nr:hypothetical protein [Polyangiaceae bacterium]